jgi:hypothetical protein
MSCFNLKCSFAFREFVARKEFYDTLKKESIALSKIKKIANDLETERLRGFN